MEFFFADDAGGQCWYY